MTRRARILVSGRVQGVFFRASTVERAEQLGLTGWVRNRSDGRVEIDAQGDAKAVASLVAWCDHGPRMANVTGVEVTEETPTESFDRFAVR